MPGTTVDVDALYAALDHKRQSGGRMSWRELAHELDISPSTFTRMAQGHRPDVDTFATLLRWLGMPAEAFTRSPAQNKEEPEPLAMISSYLRSARNIRPQDAEALDEILRVAYKRLTRDTIQ